jgi:PAS domain S-box-containing protein
MSDNPTPPSPSLPPPPGEAYMRLINRISSIILAGGDLDAVLDRVVDVVREVLEVERVSIMLVNSLTGNLTIRAARGIPRDLWSSISIAPGEGIAGRVAQDGMPLLSSDIAKTNLPAQGGDRYRDNSFASVPLMIQDRILGVLNINNRSDGEPLSEADLQLTLALAALVSLAVENADLMSSAVTLREHFRDVLRELQHGVLCTDRQASVTLCNPVASRVLGIAPDQAIGRALQTVLPPSLRALVHAMIQECRERKAHAVRELDLPIPDREGENLPVRVTLGTLRDAAGEVDAVVLVLEDLTLSREVAELRRLDELKSNFLAMVSHELRTPLTSIKGAVHLLASGAFENAPAQRRDMYDLLQKNTERLISEINNILDVNQLEHRTLTIFPRALDLSVLLRRMGEALAPSFQEKEISINLDLPDETPLTGDQERLNQVFRHLMDNALKFTPHGGSVRVWIEPDGDRETTVHIRDSGVGIDEMNRDKVFAKFFQLEHTLTRQAGGNGLGLYIAKGLVELHGGAIGFLPVEGQGAEVAVRLPLTPPRSQPPAAEPTEEIK